MSDLIIKKIPFVDDKPESGQQKLSWIQNGELLEGGYNGDKGGSLNELPDQLYQNIKTVDENFNTVVESVNQQNTDIENLKKYVDDTTNMDLIQKVDYITDNQVKLDTKVTEIDLTLTNTVSNVDGLKDQVGVVDPQDGTFRDVREDLYYIKNVIGNNSGFDINGVESAGTPSTGLKHIINDVATSLNRLISDLPKSGPSINRPQNANIGVTYFDTDLKLPIWKSETNWINSIGEVV